MKRFFLFLALIAQPLVASAEPTEEEVELFALNLYWEARSEGTAGMEAVGWVVLNRVRSRRFPSTITEVIKEGGTTFPCQWNWRCDRRDDTPTEPKAWAKAQRLAAKMLSSPPDDPTKGALWFHLDSIEAPGFLSKREKTLHLGRHFFYR